MYIKKINKYIQRNPKKCQNIAPSFKLKTPSLSNFPDNEKIVILPM